MPYPPPPNAPISLETHKGWVGCLGPSAAAAAAPLGRASSFVPLRGHQNSAADGVVGVGSPGAARPDLGG
jgi:hypothetical protein